MTNAAGRNAAITSLMVCCGFIICWSPNEISVLVNFAGHTIDFAGWFYHFTVVLVFTNSCINPFIYAAKYREFQHGVRRLVGLASKPKPKPKLNQQQQSEVSVVAGNETAARCCSSRICLCYFCL